MGLEALANTCCDMAVAMCWALLGHGAWLCLLSTRWGEGVTARAVRAPIGTKAAAAAASEEEHGRFATPLLAPRIREQI